MTQSIYKTLTPLFLDFETTNLDNGSAVRKDNSIVLACWRTNGAARHCFGDQFHQEELFAAVARADMIVAHHAKFECQWLRRMGFDMSELPPIFDTMLAQKVLASNRQWPLSLELVAQHYLLPGKQSAVHTLIDGGVCPSTIPESMLLDYCQQDVAVLEAVFRKQLDVMTENDFALLRTKCELVPVLADIEFNGMRLDPARVRAESDRLHKGLVYCEQEIEKLAPGVNWNSGKQIATLLYETWDIPEIKDRHGNPIRTLSGRPKTDADTISKLRRTTAKARKFLALKQEATLLSSALSKYITKMDECCVQSDGELYATFNQSVTKTGRLSSSGGTYKIQFQNMAKEYKPLFTASPGMVLMEVDASQLEFRVAADICRDSVALSDIRNGRDVHQHTADVLTAAGQPTSRGDAKPFTFRPLYGGSSGTDAVRSYCKAFNERYQGIYKMQSGWTVEVLKNGQYTLPWGATFYFPGTIADKNGYIENSTNIFNYPIQAFATAEIIPLLLIRFWRRIKDLHLEARVLNTVHDSILIELPEKEIDQIKQIAIDIFTREVYNELKARYNYEAVVPFGVSIKVGTHWGEGSESKHEASIL